MVVVESVQSVLNLGRTPPQPSPKRGGSQIILTSPRFGGIEGGHSGELGAQVSTSSGIASKTISYQVAVKRSRLARVHDS
jgi:hypothetical protein